jgi:hypothetical protein
LTDTLAAATGLAAAVAVFALSFGLAPELRSALLVASLCIPAMALARFLTAIASADRRFLFASDPEKGEQIIAELDQKFARAPDQPPAHRFNRERKL